MKGIKTAFTVLLSVLLLLVLLCSCNDEKESIENPHPVINADDENETSDDNGTNPDEGNTVPETPQTETVSLKLYFPDGEALYLHVEEKSVELLADDSREMAVLNELFKGPENEELSPSLEGKNLINSVVTDENGLCTIDFKYDFVTLNTGGTARESFVLGSIVNSLCELENVKSVKINIDGNTAAEFGHSTLDAELRPMTTLVAR